MRITNLQILTSLIAGIIFFCIPMIMDAPQQPNDSQQLLSVALFVFGFFLIVVGVGLFIGKRNRDKKIPFGRRERPY